MIVQAIFRLAVTVFLFLSLVAVNTAFGSGYMCSQMMSDIRDAKNGNRNPDLVKRLYRMGTYIETDDLVARKILMMAEIYLAGVISKAGFSAMTPAGPTWNFPNR